MPVLNLSEVVSSLDDSVLKGDFMKVDEHIYISTFDDILPKIRTMTPVLSTAITSGLDLYANNCYALVIPTNMTFVEINAIENGPVKDAVWAHNGKSGTHYFQAVRDCKMPVTGGQFSVQPADGFLNISGQAVPAKETVKWSGSIDSSFATYFKYDFDLAGVSQKVTLMWQRGATAATQVVVDSSSIGPSGLALDIMFGLTKIGCIERKESTEDWVVAGALTNLPSVEADIIGQYTNRYFSELAVSLKTSGMTVAVAANLSTAVFHIDGGAVAIAKYPATMNPLEVGYRHEGFDAQGSNYTSKGQYLDLALPGANGRIVIGLAVKAPSKQLVSTSDCTTLVSVCRKFLDAYGVFPCGRVGYSDDSKMTVQARFDLILRNLFDTRANEQVDPAALTTAITSNGDIGGVMLTEAQLMASSQYLSGHIRLTPFSSRLDDVGELQFPLTLLYKGAGRMITVMLHILRRSRQQYRVRGLGEIKSDLTGLTWDAQLPVAPSTGNGWAYIKSATTASKINWYLHEQSSTGTLMQSSYNFYARVQVNNLFGTSSLPFFALYTRPLVPPTNVTDPFYGERRVYIVTKNMLASANVTAGGFVLLYFGIDKPSYFTDIPHVQLVLAPSQNMGTAANQPFGAVAFSTDSGANINAEAPNLVLTHFITDDGVNVYPQELSSV